MSEWGIGIIGLGGISMGHLEGYRRQNLKVIAGADPDDRNFDQIRQRFGLERLFDDFRKVLELDEVKIADITVPHEQSIRKPIVEAAARAGKAIFMQKPLAESFENAKELVEIAESYSVPIMVNQNSVFVPGFQTMESYLRGGYIGTPYYFQIENRDWFDPSHHSWYGRAPRWIGLDMAIHHFALADHWFGNWERACAINASDASQLKVNGDTVNVVNVIYASGVCGTIINNWCYRGDLKRPHFREEFLIQGDKGTISGTSERICVAVKDPVPSEIYPEIKGKWYPDALGNSMRHFVDALDQNRPFLCEGRHNLIAMALMEGAYRSAEEGRAVALEEIYPDAPA